MDKVEIQENVPLAPLTTLGVGGSARFYAQVRSEPALEAALDFAHQHHLPIFTLGGGSNLLVRDEGFPGLVVHLTLGGETTLQPVGDLLRCTVPAGADWDGFVRLACEQGASGVECLAGIPGLTGGTPVQNVGAYGQEVAQTIQSLRVYDLQSRSFVWMSKADCEFSYRSSRFNARDRGRFLVTCVQFALKADAAPCLTYAELARHFAGTTPSPMEVYHAVREIRRDKGMLLAENDPNSRSAGSFFKNPVVALPKLNTIAAAVALPTEDVPHWPSSGDSPEGSSVKLSAAWLVENAGFPKGFIDGRVGISSRHSLALINRGGATFADVGRLRDRIQRAVQERFGVRLEQEPVELGA